MKIVLLPILLFLFFNVMSQINLPNPEDIKRIEISDTSMVKWYQPNELLKLLPKFAVADGTYGTKAVPFQYGKFILKNGTEINWMANSKDSILLTEGSTEQLFVLPKEEKAVFKIWDKDGNDSYIDINGNPAEKPKEKPVFSEGLAPVQVIDKWGYMNEKGEMVIQPRWKGFNYYSSPLGNFSEGLAVVYEEKNAAPVPDENYTYDTYKCAYINTKGEYVIPPKKFRGSCGNFYQGLARIEIDMNGDEYQKGKGYIGFIDTQGNWAIPPQYYQASDFQKGYALIQSEAMPKDLYIKIPGTDLVRNNYNRKSLYLIDKQGNKVEGVKDCRQRFTFYDGLAVVFDEKPQPAFINEQCEEVFRIPNDVQPENYYFYEGMLLVKKENNGKKMYGYYDTTGKLVIDFKFIGADHFSDGLAGVGYEENGKNYGGYIDKTGKLILKNTYRNAPFKNGLSFQHLYTWTISERPNARNIYGYMNKQGKYVWLSPRAENYLDKEWIKENYIGVKR